MRRMPRLRNYSFGSAMRDLSGLDPVQRSLIAFCPCERCGTHGMIVTNRHHIHCMRPGSEFCESNCPVPEMDQCPDCLGSGNTADPGPVNNLSISR